MSYADRCHCFQRYLHHKDQLALIARRNGTEKQRWCLKSPVHLAFVKHLKTARRVCFLAGSVMFPDRSMRSSCSRRVGCDALAWALPPRSRCAHARWVVPSCQAFPDAKLVWSHRDPAQSLPSLASLFRAFSEM
jgi:hypothetical protein